MSATGLNSRYCVLDENQMKYVNKISRIVSEPIRLPRGLSKILDHLYLGSYDDAIEIENLKSEGITHVLNTVDVDCQTGSSFYGDEFKYYGFKSEDDESYPIMRHFEMSYKFIEDAFQSNGKCLIHCMAGVNRSGALTVAYVMLHNNIGPVSATKLVFQERGMILTNAGFIEQLVKLATDKGVLSKDADEV